MEDPQVDATMTRRALVGLLLLAVLALPAAVGGMGGAFAHPVAPTSSAAVHGNITGPTVLATGANSRYVILGGGGPAVLPNGTLRGNLTYYASVSANNLTGVTISPGSAALLNGTPGQPLLQAGPNAQTVTINVEIASVFNKTNASVNFSWVVNVVRPYVIAAEIVNPNNATVQSFPVLISLDGTLIGNTTVPSIQPHGDYNLSYSYATLGLGQGYHTFSISLAGQHGLVRFANGSTVYSATVYVPGPATDYTLWYVTGAVAFFGVLFILGARLGARRRSPSKK